MDRSEAGEKGAEALKRKHDEQGLTKDEVEQRRKAAESRND